MLELLIIVNYDIELEPNALYGYSCHQLLGVTCGSFCSLEDAKKGALKHVHSYLHDKVFNGGKIPSIIINRFWETDDKRVVEFKYQTDHKIYFRVVSGSN